MLSTIKEKRNSIFRSLKAIIKSRSFWIASLIIIVGFLCLLIGFRKDKAFEKEEQALIEEFFVNDSNDVSNSNDEIFEHKSKKAKYIAVLEIPSINLRSGMVDPTSNENNVNQHIQILSPSDFPNVINGNFVLAAHSGTGQIAYFQDLIKVKKDDLVYISYDGIKYIYQVTNIYNQNKNGSIIIYRNNNTTTLTLTTCNSYNPKKEQLVVIAELIGNTPYA